ncbi:hypothetical protein KP79_PYT08638 [Mizuhopecten yessoensis]|uniref:Uncharacterized protein n=1 Tax=Mizuhopecten yessoensis TaxID=6573 RepID=A0A210R0D8_MIZYE|nr:hypothetical protein KP79_PYT08638 [Mizuhopecten yessoensis]
MSTVTRRRIARQKRLFRSEGNFSRAVSHMDMIGDRIRKLMTRHDRAQRSGMNALKYNLRIRLAVMEGVRNMYYEFAKKRAEEVVTLRKELYGQDLEVVVEE